VLLSALVHLEGDKAIYYIVIRRTSAIIISISNNIIIIMASTTGGATGGAVSGGISSGGMAAAGSSAVGGSNPSGSGGPGASNSLPDIIDYKVKLLGLLPDGYMYLGGSRRWDLSTACFIKVPSEMTCYDGKIDRKGHPTLIGSGILERKYGLTVQLPTIAESERANSVARESVKGKQTSFLL